MKRPVRVYAKGGRKVPLTPEQRALVPRGPYIPPPPCQYCGQEPEPGHSCAEMHQHFARYRLGCLRLPEDHEPEQPCTSTCGVHPLRPGVRWIPAYARRRS